MKKTIALFETTRAAITAERLCCACNISCQAIPVPREITADCGIALELDDGVRDAVERILRQENIRARFFPT
jgi:hypothetical protein